MATQGTDISKAKLPAELEKELRASRITTIESFYCRLKGAPQVWQMLLAKYELGYDQTVSAMRALIPPDKLKELDRPTPPSPPGGALRPIDIID